LNENLFIADDKLQMKIRKKIVLATAMCAFIFLGGSVAYKAFQPPIPLVLDISGHPTIGTGKIQIVVFEDFSCVNCRVFTEEIFPEITKRYIDTGKAQLVLIPIAFGENSKPLANAVLSVYHLAPQSFVPFVKKLSITQAVLQNDILSVAHSVGGIDLQVLQEKIGLKIYYAEIDRNLYWARSVMGEDFGTPTLLINGIEVPAGSLDLIEARILELEGVP